MTNIIRYCIFPKYHSDKNINRKLHNMRIIPKDEIQFLYNVILKNFQYDSLTTKNKNMGRTLLLKPDKKKSVKKFFNILNQTNKKKRFCTIAQKRIIWEYAMMHIMGKFQIKTFNSHFDNDFQTAKSFEIKAFSKYQIITNASESCEESKSSKSQEEEHSKKKKIKETQKRKTR
ncbi:hypothetical protein M0813_25792 [Anaeramoeba flamelloides]|uniref:Homing endonuclease LAGLIDADG domain-containing protein n=1 Tax=Anaeramoeba flamelloides TaxID=1746091 RepID=A0ABQ8Y138_9EUKA|nr:hypothetical protein M0813_25792 [Anaeramoeba flamelloides]